MGCIVAIDPGKRSGFAVFADGGVLDEAGTMTEAEILKLPPVPACLERVVIELPVVYPGRNVPPADLIDLAVMIGELRGCYRYYGAEVRLVKPRTWKGTVPKPIHNKRVVAALTPKERALLPRRPRARDFDHNMLDAVGLGLWELKRL